MWERFQWGKQQHWVEGVGDWGTGLEGRGMILKCHGKGGLEKGVRQNMLLHRFGEIKALKL